MIEVAAFPARVLRLRDEVTSPLGALWLQGRAEGGLHSKEHRRRPVFVGSVVVMRLQDSGLKTRWPMTEE